MSISMIGGADWGHIAGIAGRSDFSCGNIDDEE